MAEHPNVTRAREAFAAFNRGNFATYRDFFAEDIVWHVGGSHSMSGDYRGRDALFDYFERVRQLTEGSLRTSPQEILADADHCGVFTRVTAERDGRQLNVIQAQAFRVNADGKFSEYWALADDQDAVDAFWS